MTKPLTIRDALGQLSQAVAASLGLAPTRVVVYMNDRPILDVPMTPAVFIAPGDAAAMPDTEQTVDYRRGLNHSKCVDDILRVLEEVGHPMTTTRILSEMAKRGIEWSQRHVCGFLARMVEDGTLINRIGAKPAGYRLPEWETPGTQAEE